MLLCSGEKVTRASSSFLTLGLNAFSKFRNSRRTRKSSVATTPTMNNRLRVHVLQFRSFATRSSRVIFTASRSIVSTVSRSFDKWVLSCFPTRAETVEKNSPLVLRKKGFFSTGERSRSEEISTFFRTSPREKGRLNGAFVKHWTAFKINNRSTGWEIRVSMTRGGN